MIASSTGVVSSLVASDDLLEVLGEAGVGLLGDELLGDPTKLVEVLDPAGAVGLGLERFDRTIRSSTQAGDLIVRELVGGEGRSLRTVSQKPCTAFCAVFPRPASVAVIGAGPARGVQRCLVLPGPVDQAIDRLAADSAAQAR